MPTPTVYRRPDSRWWWIARTAPLPDGSSRRVLLSGRALGIALDTHTREQAQAVVYSHYLVDPAEQPGSPNTLGWLRRDVKRIGELYGLRAGTVIKYEKAARYLAGVFGDGLPVADVKRRPHVEQFKRALLERGIRAATVNSILQAIQAVFSRLVDSGAIEVNPFTRHGKLPEPENIRRSLTPDEVRRFLDAVDAWHPERFRNPPQFYEGLRRLAWIYLYTARRRAEILAVTRDGIDLDRAVMRVPNIKRRGRPLSEIDIHPSILDDVRWFLDAFPLADRPFRIAHPDWITHHIKLWLRLAGLPESLHLHSLRHTALTLAVSSGQNIRAIQRYVDHSTVRMTERYLHERPSGGLELGHDFRNHALSKKANVAE